MDDDALWLDAALDGELDAARSLAFERRLASDPALRARWEARRALRGAVRGHASYHAAPDALRARIESALAEAAPATGAGVGRAAEMPRLRPGEPARDPARPDAPAASVAASSPAPAPRPPHADDVAPARRPARAHPRARAWTWPWLLASGTGGAAVAAAVTALIVSSQMAHAPRDGEGPLLALAAADDLAQAGLAAEAVSAHTRAMLVGETIEVASSDRHTVRPWLAARLNFVPSIADFPDEGYALAGARRDVIGGETAAALVYRHGAHVISVFVRPLREPGAAPSGASAPAERPPALRVVRGFNVVEMTHAGMAYSLVSDMNAHEMAQLAQLLRRD